MVNSLGDRPAVFRCGLDHGRTGATTIAEYCVDLVQLKSVLGGYATGGRGDAGFR